MGIPLVVLNSPYRSLLAPFLDYLDHLLALGEDHMVTIVIPEFIPAAGGSTFSTTRPRSSSRAPFSSASGWWWWTSPSTSADVVRSPPDR